MHSTLSVLNFESEAIRDIGRKKERSPCLTPFGSHLQGILTEMFEVNIRDFVKLILTFKAFFTTFVSPHPRRE